MGVHKVIRVAYKMGEGKAKEAEKIPKDGKSGKFIWR
jgi:hypothetical protein